MALGGCSSDQDQWWEPRSNEVRVYSSPYEDVDWSNDLRLTAQHHDHVAASATALLAYDAAGYDVVSLMDYSGDATKREALRQRLWPPEQWVPDTLRANLKNIDIFLPNAEEVGVPPRPGDGQLKHATSTFLETYIEGSGTWGATPLPHRYGTMEQLFGLVRELGGTPCLAHPWNYRYDDLNLGESYCVEIYSALAGALRELNVPYYSAADRNKTLVSYWDGVLKRNQRVFAIAVNDHFGPQTRAPISERVRDSGKILVFAKAATLDAYQQAFAAGSFFAVQDVGTVKNRYPTIHSIDVQDELIFLETVSAVTWIADGAVIATGPMLRYRDLTYGMTYVRAEVAGEDGSIVYTQAFPVRPIGDVDGDYQVDFVDAALCIDAPALVSVWQRACDARASLP